MYNCVDTQCFRPHRAPGLRALWGFPTGSTVFAAVGTLGTGVNKRVDVIIRAVAAAKHKGVPVALVVCGDGSQRTALEQLAAALGVQPLVRFLGTRQDIPDVLAACDAFCHAAPFEPFGIVCIEAMAMGLPVVVPDSGGIREAVEDGVTGYVYPALDHWALANAMCRLAAEENARIGIGRAARAMVEQRFSAQAYVRQLYGFYGLTEETLVQVQA
jgi:glycosyltransferase involved in cell wall biosynthesis